MWFFMCTLFLCLLLHCEINFPLTVMRSWVDAGSILLDLQNCELNKPPFFTRYPAMTVIATLKDLRQMWTLGAIYLVRYDIWAGSWFSLTKVSPPWYSMTLSKSEHPVCVMGQLATEGIECQEESNQRSLWNGQADSRTRKLCGEMCWWFRSHISCATFRDTISSGWWDWREIFRSFHSLPCSRGKSKPTSPIGFIPCSPSLLPVPTVSPP